MNIPIDITGTELKTPRLLLRSWRETDLEDFYAYASVDGVGQMAGWQPHRSREESRAILEMFLREKKTFALEKDGRVIGSLGIEEYEEAVLPDYADRKGRELGFVLAKDQWGQGLMPEAVNAVTDWLFAEQGLDFLTCCHFADNTRSAAVQHKCGFRYVQTHLLHNRAGDVRKSVLNLLTRADWEQRKTT